MFFLLRMTKKAASPPISARAPTPTMIQTHMGMEPSPPFTVWDLTSVKVTLLPSTLPPSASVTFPGKVMDWVTSSWDMSPISSSVPILTTYSLP